MKHSDTSNYNIYGRRRSNNDRRKTFVVVCLFICMLCVILDIIFIAKIIKKGKSDNKAPETSVTLPLETDESGNPIETSLDPSAVSESETTPSAAVQVVDAETRAANLEALRLSRKTVRTFWCVLHQHE